MTLNDCKILTFDVIGTLIDFEAGLLDYFRPIVARAGASLDDAGILASFGQAEGEQHQLTPGATFTAMLDGFTALWRRGTGYHNLKTTLKAFGCRCRPGQRFPTRLMH